MGKCYKNYSDSKTFRGIQGVLKSKTTKESRRYNPLDVEDDDDEDLLSDNGDGYCGEEILDEE